MKDERGASFCYLTFAHINRPSFDLRNKQAKKKEN